MIPPYGSTAGDWDLEPGWDWLGYEVSRLLRPTGQVVLHGHGRSLYDAVAAFRPYLEYRFELAWVKVRPDGRPRTTAWVSNFEPLRAHELVLVFKLKGAPTKQLTFNLKAMHRHVEAGYGRRGASPSYQGKDWSGQFRPSTNGRRWPIDVVFAEPDSTSTLYAAKPQDLTRYLLLTLTQPGDYVLDPYAGSGTTLRVAYFLGRRSFGLEASPRVFPILQATTELLRTIRYDGGHDDPK